MRISRSHCVTALLAGLLWITFVYVRYDHLSWNVSSRLSLTFALVERGTFCIDDYWQRPELNTQDVASAGGHYYSDKIFGVSLLAVPVFALVHLVEKLRGVEFSTFVRHWLVCAFSVSLLAAGAGAVFHRLARRYLIELGHIPPRADALAALATFCVFCGTMLVTYAGMLMPYLPGIFFLLLALWRIEARDERETSLSPRQINKLRVGGIGLLLGAAVLCDYLAGVPAVALLIYLTWRERSWQAGVIAALCAALPLIPFALYCLILFGQLSVPYRFEVLDMFRDSMARGIMGATVPSLTVMWLITFHPYRGLFFHSPHLLGGPFGWVKGWSLGPCWHSRQIVFASIFVVLLVYNSAYFMWWGGWGFSPRHLAFTVPFLGLSMLVLWQRMRSIVLFTVLGLWGVFVHVIVYLVSSEFPDRPQGAPLVSLLEPDLSRYDYPWIFGRYIFRLFQMGEMPWNIGVAMGFRGPASVLPLALLWGIGALVIVMLCRSSAPPQSTAAREQ